MADNKKLRVGYPMGIKINDEELNINGLTLEVLAELTKLYHGGKYVIGHDTELCDKPHYHIHWFSVKETTEGAMKTFRSNVIKKQFPHISRSFRFYTGQDLPSAKPEEWYTYAAKVSMYAASNMEVSELDYIEKHKGTAYEVKRLKKIKSEKLAQEKKEKQDFKFEMFDFVKKNAPIHNDIQSDYYGEEFRAFGETVINFLASKERYGGIKACFIKQWYLEYKMKHSEEKWTSKEVFKYVMNKL